MSRRGANLVVNPARLFARAHLTGFPDYFSRLAVIDAEACCPLTGKPSPRAVALSELTFGCSTSSEALTTARVVAIVTRESVEAQLMLDTGAVRTVINPSVLSALGVSYDTAVRGSIQGVTGGAEGFAEAVGLDIAHRAPRTEYIPGFLVANALEPIVARINREVNAILQLKEARRSVLAP